MKKLLLVLVFGPSTLYAFTENIFPEYSACKAYTLKSYVRAQEILEKRQVEDPNNPVLNYNLGAIYYKQKQYDLAEQNFARASTYAFGKDESLVEKSTFNQGNCFYQKTLQILPEDWENIELDQEVSKNAVQTIKQSIEKYKKVLASNRNNTKAQENKKMAEDILAKLLKQKRNKSNKDEKQKQPQKKPEKNDKQQPKEQNKQEDKKQKPQENQQQKQPKDQANNFNKRRTESQLAQLEQQEKNLQKKLFKQKLKKIKAAKNEYQKPW